jgi:hypothetical protein
MGADPDNLSAFQFQHRRSGPQTPVEIVTGIE